MRLPQLGLQWAYPFARTCVCLFVPHIAQCVALDKLATVSFWLKYSGRGNSNKKHYNNNSRCNFNHTMQLNCNGKS